MPDFLGILDEMLYDSLSWYFCVRMERTKERFKVTQALYVSQILQEYALEKLEEFTNPMVSNFYEELERHKIQPVEDTEEYECMIGALIHLSTRSSPEIAKTVGILSWYQSKHNQSLRIQLKRVFRYFKGTVKTKIVLDKHSELRLTFYCNSDFEGSKSVRKSRTGWIELLNEKPATWASPFQTCNALSTAKAEYIVLSEYCNETKRIRLFLAKIEISQAEAA